MTRDEYVLVQSMAVDCMYCTLQTGVRCSVVLDCNSLILLLLFESVHRVAACQTDGDVLQLLSYQYHPSRYPMQSTSYVHTSRSVSALGFGVFERRGDLGAHGYEPLYIHTEANECAPELRFDKVFENGCEGWNVCVLCCSSMMVILLMCLPVCFLISLLLYHGRTWGIVSCSLVSLTHATTASIRR